MLKGSRIFMSYFIRPLSCILGHPNVVDQNDHGVMTSKFLIGLKVRLSSSFIHKEKVGWYFESPLKSAYDWLTILLRAPFHM